MKGGGAPQLRWRRELLSNKQPTSGFDKSSNKPTSGFDNKHIERVEEQALHKKAKWRREGYRPTHGIIYNITSRHA